MRTHQDWRCPAVQLTESWSSEQTNGGSEHAHQMLGQLVDQGCDVACDRPQGACKALNTFNPCLWQGLWRLYKADTLLWRKKRIKKELGSLWASAELTILPGCKGNVTLVFGTFAYSWRIGALLLDVAYGRLAKTVEIKTVLFLISTHRGLTTAMTAGCTMLALLLENMHPWSPISCLLV